MVGRSPVVADAEQRRELLGLSQSRDRGEADRSRAILLTLRGWTSPEIADAFGVREDTVRLWRSAFMRGGVGTLRATVAPGPAAIKAERALDVAEELLSVPVANRPNFEHPAVVGGQENAAAARAHPGLTASARSRENQRRGLLRCIRRTGRRVASAG